MSLKTLALVSGVYDLLFALTDGALCLLTIGLLLRTRISTR